ncbi:DUF6053 domain-containing protein [Lysobacter enzymogenes]
MAATLAQGVGAEAPPTTARPCQPAACAGAILSA